MQLLSLSQNGPTTAAVEWVSQAVSIGLLCPLGQGSLFSFLIGAAAAIFTI